MTAASPAWSPADIDLLTALWPDHDISASAIGDRVGRSRNAVIGKAARLGLPHRASTYTEAGAARKPQEPVVRVRTAPLAPAVVSPQSVRALVHYDDLRRGFSQCRFIPGSPLGDQSLYCGDATVPGKSYCQHHLTVCSGLGTPSERQAVFAPREGRA